jgi:hypothetical protein
MKKRRGKNGSRFDKLGRVSGINPRHAGGKI